MSYCEVFTSRPSEFSLKLPIKLRRQARGHELSPFKEGIRGPKDIFDLFDLFDLQTWSIRSSYLATVVMIRDTGLKLCNLYLNAYEQFCSLPKILSN